MVRRRTLVIASAAAVAAAPAWASSARRGEAAALHALNRLGFGPRAGDLSNVARDPMAWVEEQLAPGSAPLPEGLRSRLQEEPLATADPIALVRELVVQIRQNQQEVAAQAAAMQPADMQPPSPGGPLSQTPLARFVRQHQLPAFESRLLRALASPWQLQEVMVDFWFNHFNVFQGKNWMRVLVGPYEHQAIRPHALGRFADLLQATAHHPGMLYYLDNWQSVASRGGARGLNENYARELMELHTLGVDGGYTQADVTTLARMLTGWTLQPVQPRVAGGPDPDATTSSRPGFRFNARVHDDGPKVWLGQPVTARGKAEGDHALAVLAAHPATARHIAFKLAQYFVADQPDAALVDHLAQVYLREDGQIVPVLRALFTSDAFWLPDTMGAKFKTPYQYTLSAVRAAGMIPANVLGLAGALAAQGMPLYGCPTPDGWRHTAAAWLNPEGLNKRIQFATQLARARMADPERSMVALQVWISGLGPLVTPATRDEVLANRHQPVVAAALLLAGPGMMNR